MPQRGFASSRREGTGSRVTSPRPDQRENVSFAGYEQPHPPRHSARTPATGNQRVHSYFSTLSRSLMAIDQQNKPRDTYRQFDNYTDDYSRPKRTLADVDDLLPAWYVGNRRKQEVEVLAATLSALPRGAFFVRVMKSHPGCYGLVTMDDNDRIRNHVIEPMDDCFRVITGRRETDIVIADTVMQIIRELSDPRELALPFPLRPDISVSAMAARTPSSRTKHREPPRQHRDRDYRDRDRHDRGRDHRDRDRPRDRREYRDDYRERDDYRGGRDYREAPDRRTVRSPPPREYDDYDASRARSPPPFDARMTQRNPPRDDKRPSGGPSSARNFSSPAFTVPKPAAPAKSPYDNDDHNDGGYLQDDDWNLPDEEPLDEAMFDKVPAANKSKAAQLPPATARRPPAKEKSSERPFSPNLDRPFSPDLVDSEDEGDMAYAQPTLKKPTATPASQQDIKKPAAKKPAKPQAATYENVPKLQPHDGPTPTFASANPLFGANLAGSEDEGADALDSGSEDDPDRVKAGYLSIMAATSARGRKPTAPDVKVPTKRSVSPDVASRASSQPEEVGKTAATKPTTSRVAFDEPDTASLWSETSVVKDAPVAKKSDKLDKEAKKIQKETERLEKERKKAEKAKAKAEKEKSKAEKEKSKAEKEKSKAERSDKTEQPEPSGESKPEAKVPSKGDIPFTFVVPLKSALKTSSSSLATPASNASAGDDSAVAKVKSPRKGVSFGSAEEVKPADLPPEKPESNPTDACTSAASAAAASSTKPESETTPAAEDEDEFYPTSQPAPVSLLASLGFTSDQQRMNVVLSKLPDSNDDKNALMSEMYLSPTPKSVLSRAL